MNGLPLTPSRGALVAGLHDSISGDFLLDAAGPGRHIPISEATAADVVRWAVNALLESTRPTTRDELIDIVAVAMCMPPLPAQAARFAYGDMATRVADALLGVVVDPDAACEAEWEFDTSFGIMCSLADGHPGPHLGSVDGNGSVTAQVEWRSPR